MTVEIQVHQAPSGGTVCVVRPIAVLAGRTCHGKALNKDGGEGRSSPRQHVLAPHRTSRGVQSGLVWQALTSFSSLRRHVDDDETKLSSRSSPRLLSSLVKSHGVWGYFFGWPHRTFLVGELKDSVTQLDRLGRFGWLLSPTRRRSSCDVSSFPYSDPTSNAARRVILGWSNVGSVLDIAHMIFETGGPICTQLR